MAPKAKPKSGPVIGDRGALNQPTDPWASLASRTEAASEMMDVYQTAAINVSLYGQALSNACDSFKNFTESKIDEMKNDDIDKKIFDFVFSLSIDLLDKVLPGVGGLKEVGVLIRGRLKDGLKNLMTSPFDAAFGDINKDALKKAMRELSETGKGLTAKWTAAGSGPSDLQILRSIATSLQNNLKGNARRQADADKKQADFLDFFHDADAEEVDALLEYYYAVPTPSSSNNHGWELYKTLLHRFAHLYAWNMGTTQDKLDANAHTPSHIPAIAAQFESDGRVEWWKHRQR